MQAYIELEDGTVFQGQSFGFPTSVSGEFVFNTGMTGYTETFTDPSYKGEILVLTYPLIGNYGIPRITVENQLAKMGESGRAQLQGLVVCDYSQEYSHWEAQQSLGDWLKAEKVPAITGIDTRALTKRLREQGAMLGKLVCSTQQPVLYDPNKDALVPQVSIKEPVTYKGTGKKVVLIDCGAKANIIRSLINRGVTVVRVPWDYDPLKEKPDGILISNGPGDPKMCQTTIENIRRAMQKKIPIFGICLGHQLLALAAGADTYKLKYGHRSQNQPCIQVGTRRCYITSQNHGFAVDDRTLPSDWEHWFFNANDSTNEGIRHKNLPFMSVQFHPEACPGPTDTNFLFDDFVTMLGK
jgi:carbamoyl-phosphate synthase small subunit